jgi:hypothetical protein
LDSTGDVGRYSSVTVGTDRFPIVSYFDTTQGDLKVAHCTNSACTAWSTGNLDATGVVGQYTSIAIGTDGMPVIGYYDVTNHDLKLARCANTSCTTVITRRVVDGGGDVGQYAAITVAPDGVAFLSYYDNTGKDLKTARPPAG